MLKGIVEGVSLSPFGTAVGQITGLNGGFYDDRQEDRVLNAVVTLQTAREARQALETAFAETDRKTSGHTHGGSTATVAIITPDGKLTVAQVGDSPVAVYLCNPEAGIFDTVNLTQDQSPSAPAERARIEAAGGFVTDGETPRLNGVLAVARSFGDKMHGAGITAEPHIQSYDVSRYFNDPNLRLVVAVSSDGLSHHTPLEDFSTDVGRASLEEVARRMIGRALTAANYKGTNATDNISVSLAEIRPRATNGFLVGVADGHGQDGDIVAAIVQETVQAAVHNFDPTLETAVAYVSPTAAGLPPVQNFIVKSILGTDLLVCQLPVDDRTIDAAKSALNQAGVPLRVRFSNSSQCDVIEVTDLEALEGAYGVRVEHVAPRMG